MRAMILSQPGPDAGTSVASPDRFSLLAQAIRHGGIDAVHSPVGTASELKQRLKIELPDITFSAAYYTTDPGVERENVNGLLEREGRAYIGSSQAALDLVLSKATLKKQWRSAGLATPDYHLIRRTTHNLVEGIEKIYAATDFPYIVKPNLEGNSRGLGEDSIVFSRPDLIQLVEKLLDAYDEILVEQYLGRYADIREFTVAMIGTGIQTIVMPCEITLKTPKKLRIVTTVDKDEHNTLALPIDDPGLREKLIAFSRRAFFIAGVQDYSRCDVILGNGQMYAIEINGQPMVPDKWFEACARGEGLEGDAYLNAIFLAGISRNLREGNIHSSIPEDMRAAVPPGVYQKLCADSPERWQRTDP